MIPPKGINWQESRQRYQVRISVDGKRYHVGRYKSLKGAKKALRIAEIWKEQAIAWRNIVGA